MKRLLLIAMLATALAGCDKTHKFTYVPTAPIVECEDKPCREHAPRCNPRCDECKCCCEDSAK